MSSSHPHPPHHHDPVSTSSAPPVSSISPPSSTTSSVPPPIHPLPTPSIPSSVRLMCSYGGRILPRPGDHLLRYVGGETRMISLPKPSSFSTLISLLSSLLPNKSPPVVKYQLPHEDLDSLISLSSDDDLINMLEELDRMTNPSAGVVKSPRLRLFLFPASGEGTGGAGGGGFGSVLSAGESNQWFLDALNSVTPLERRRSEASSSMLSDQPDYLTGIDTGSESPSLNDRSPVNPSDHTDRPEPAEPTEPAQPAQPAEIQTQPAGPAQPVYYMPQPMPVYYVPAPMPYMQPSMDGRGPVPMHGFMPVPLDQILHQIPTSTNPPPAGSYLFDPQPPAGGYLYEPQPPPAGFMRAPIVYQHQQQVVSEPGLKPVNGGDIKGGGGGRNV